MDGTFIGLAAGVQTVVNLAICVENPTGLTTDADVGSKIMSMYYFIQIQPQAAQGNVDFYIHQSPSNSLTMPVPGTTGGNINRKWILHEEKGLPGVFNNGAPPLTFRGVIRIPRGRQRQGEADRIILRTVCSTAHDMCVKCIYKVYD